MKRVKFSPYHPSVIASASYDMTIRIHDVNVSTEDSCLAILDYHKEFVYGIDWNLHVKGQLASCSWDKTVKLSTPNFLL